MKSQNFRLVNLLISIPILLLLSSCAAGDAQFAQENPAGFWYGVWHGIIAFISLIIHTFNENVNVYEINNTGGWYDFGFLLGVIFIWGGGSHVSCKSAANKKREKEWEEIGDKVENKVMRKLKEWAEEEEGTDSGKEWEEICEKVEKKLKRKIQEWAEKD
ncbi:MAG: hypothetical protein JRC86_11825 [Deltaproteobacteria bacterium]|nr:hypothetical protein [Deltaproteobacteria bacterium]